MTKDLGTSSRAVALRMILAVKTINAMPFEEAAPCIRGEVPWPTDEVLATLVPGSNDLRAVCIALAWLAHDRWTEEDALAELAKELDKVQDMRAQLEFEGQYPELYADPEEDE